MPVTDEGVKEEYAAAYEDWQAQLQRLHRVFLQGERPSSPDRMKGLLNREVRAFQRYTRARQRLLGIPDAGDQATDDELGF